MIPSQNTAPQGNMNMNQAAGRFLGELLLFQYYGTINALFQAIVQIGSFWFLVFFRRNIGARAYGIRMFLLSGAILSLVMTIIGAYAEFSLNPLGPPQKLDALTEFCMNWYWRLWLGVSIAHFAIRKIEKRRGTYDWNTVSLEYGHSLLFPLVERWWQKLSARYPKLASLQLDFFEEEFYFKLYIESALALGIAFLFKSLVPVLGNILLFAALCFVCKEVMYYEKAKDNFYTYNDARIMSERMVKLQVDGQKKAMHLSAGAILMGSALNQKTVSRLITEQHLREQQLGAPPSQAATASDTLSPTLIANVAQQVAQSSPASESMADWYQRERRQADRQARDAEQQRFGQPNGSTFSEET